MSTESSDNAFAAFPCGQAEEELKQLLSIRPMGNWELCQYTGMTQGSVSGGLGHRRMAGEVLDTGQKYMRPSGHTEAVWALGDDRLVWFPPRLISVRRNATKIEAALAEAARNG